MLNSVYVVHNFRHKKFSSKVLFHDNTMLSSVYVSPPNFG